MLFQIRWLLGPEHRPASENSNKNTRHVVSPVAHWGIKLNMKQNLVHYSCPGPWNNFIINIDPQPMAKIQINHLLHSNPTANPGRASKNVTGLLNLLRENTIVCSLLHKTPLVQPQVSPGQPSAVALTRPSHSTVVKTLYLNHHPRPDIHVASRAQPRFCACNPTSRTCPPRHVP